MFKITYPSHVLSGGALRLILCGACFLAPLPAFAQPTWWTADPKAGLTAADQSGKGLALYFETDRSSACLEMNEKTWPVVDTARADRNYIWLRFNPQQHQKFFEFYDVFRTPEIVILDSKAREKGRLQGFKDADIILDMIEAIYRNESGSNVVVLPNGEVVSVEERAKMIEAAREGEGRHFVFDNFEKYNELNDIDSARAEAYMNREKAIRIEPSMGVIKSRALYVGADVVEGQTFPVNPAAVIRFDVSKGQSKSLENVELVEGRVRVEFLARAINLDEQARELACLVVTKITDPPPTIQGLVPDENVTAMTLYNRIKEWENRSVTSAPFNFRTHKAWLLLWVNQAGHAYLVDDMKVDLLPAEGGDESAAQAKRTPNPLAILHGNANLPAIWRVLDKDGNGRIEKTEVPAYFHGMFEDADGNGDGVIEIGEPPRKK